MKILLILLIINSMISFIDCVFLWFVIECVKQRLGLDKEFKLSYTNNAIVKASLFRYGIISTCPVLNFMFAIGFITSFDNYVDIVYDNLKGYIKDEN